MASVRSPNVSSVTMQNLGDVRLNPFAVQLLVESYAGEHGAYPTPVTFVWRGVLVRLEPAPTPSPDPTP